jgi:hypothetical protein
MENTIKKSLIRSIACVGNVRWLAWLEFREITGKVELSLISKVWNNVGSLDFS